MFDDLISKLQTPEPVLLNLTDMPRGVDNYHIDVKLSARFCEDFENLLALFIKRETTQSGSPSEKAEGLVKAFQDSYLDMMSVLIHRIKTDLSPTEVNVLQFAVFRHVLERVQTTMDDLIRNLRNQLSDLRSRNSPKSLVVQEQIFWLSKHYGTKIFNINRRFLSLLQQIEAKQLQAIRRQYLNPGDQYFLDMLFNPMLCTTNLDSPSFLIGHYLIWNRKGETSEFSSLNAQVEALFSETLPEAGFTPLVDDNRLDGQLEIHDDLKGLGACQSHLGPAPNQKNFISENFCWLDRPENFELLFDETKHAETARSIRKSQGLKAWWQCRKQVHRLREILNRLRKNLKSRKLLTQLAASSEARAMWRQVMSEHLDAIQLCNYLSRELSYKDFVRKFKAEQVFSPAELKVLKDAVVTKRVAESDAPLVKFLTSWALYRQHLKYYRFAHRVFNRISILTEDDKLQLSSQAGTLYHLPTAAEVTNDETRIAHHIILKADVRGSTTVTDELEKQGLNPASYFSLRFFSPINKVLSVYGAHKVFIEGDAIILALLEYEHSPQHWFAVARACGVAKAMLAVVNASNQHSRQIGLRPLELGMGICFADSSPRYLYDGEQPIMISSAIGQADRLSSCSWKLRAAITRHPFNVEVLDMAEEDASKGEKGQEQIQYNLNGILLENAAFAKLQNEIALTRTSLRIAGQDVVCHFGEYPDTQGKMRSLVIREARVGLWRNERIEPNARDARFYEVVTNNQVISVIHDRLYAKKRTDNHAS